MRNRFIEDVKKGIPSKWGNLPFNTPVCQQFMLKYKTKEMSKLIITGVGSEAIIIVLKIPTIKAMRYMYQQDVATLRFLWKIETICQPQVLTLTVGTASH